MGTTKNNQMIYFITMIKGISHHDIIIIFLIIISIIIDWYYIMSPSQPSESSLVRMINDYIGSSSKSLPSAAHALYMHEQKKESS